PTIKFPFGHILSRPNHPPFFESSTQLPGMYFRIKYIRYEG
ncbi:2328_t:CDS:2, partial [Funneliformis mosseae]